MKSVPKPKAPCGHVGSGSKLGGGPVKYSGGDRGKPKVVSQSGKGKKPIP